jgi:hypothetical protein
MCVVSTVMGEWWGPGTVKNPFELPQMPYTIPTGASVIPINIPAVTSIPAVPVTIPDPQPGPNAISWNVIQQDPKLAQMMLEALAKLEAIDKRLGLMEQCLVEKDEKKKVKAKLKRIAKKSVKKKA